MIHPFLRLHLAGEDVFVTSGIANPRSVRDEIRRAHLLARQLTKVYEMADIDVVTIGAGAAGVAFASSALALGARRVTLLEGRAAAFGLQRGVLHRDISPTLYEWPNPAHQATHLLHVPSSVLPFTEGTADGVVQQWDGWFAALRAAHPGRLDVRTGHRAEFEPTAATGRRLIAVSPTIAGGGHDILVADLVVDARGFQPETVCLQRPCLGTDHFHSFRFWELDTYDQPTRSVLVSGGGDGALQDFLRVAAPGITTRQLLNAVPAGTANAVAANVAARLDHLNRQWTVGDDITERDAIADLEGVIHGAATTLAQNAAVVNAFAPLLTPAANRRIDLAHTGQLFDWCYPLNRFLAVLLLELALVLELPWTRRPDRRLLSVEPLPGTGHTCAADAATCAGFPHLAQVDGSPQEAFDTIVIRHGAPGHDLPPAYQLLPLANGREHLPVAYLP